MQASPIRSGLPPVSPSKTPSPNRSGLPPSKTPSPTKRNSPFNHLPLSVTKRNQLSPNKMANRLLQLSEVRRKSEMIEVPKAINKITYEEYFAKKKAFWDQIRFINEENSCLSKNEDYIALRNLLLDFSKITPVQVCSAVKDATDKGYYLGESDFLINPTPEPQAFVYSGPPAYYNNGAPQPSAPPANATYYTGATAPPPPPYYNARYNALTKPSAPPANNHDPTVPRGGSKRKNRKGRKTRRN